MQCWVDRDLPLNGMVINENVPLAPFTTFKIGGRARYFTEAKTVEDIREAVSFARDKNLPLFILGAGSNILVSDNGFPGLVIKISLRGISHKEKDGEILITAAAGEAWDDLVAHTVRRGWCGLENLSGIPGTVGAAPIQNIGAYGVEAGNLIQSVSAVNSLTSEQKVFSREECGFTYRGSFFKSPEGKKYMIVSVSFGLSRQAPFSLAYADLETYFRDRGIGENGISSEDLRSAVLSIRAGKLPSLRDFGTAGSFFKNPLISLDDFARLQNLFPDAPHFADSSGMVKIPAGFLIEKSGYWKGMRRGEVGVYDKHTLVLINRGSAKAKEVHSLAKEIEGAVREKFGITLEPEVNLVGEF